MKQSKQIVIGLLCTFTLHATQPTPQEFTKEELEVSLVSMPVKERRWNNQPYYRERDTNMYRILGRHQYDSEDDIPNYWNATPTNTFKRGELVLAPQDKLLRNDVAYFYGIVLGKKDGLYYVQISKHTRKHPWINILEAEDIYKFSPQEYKKTKQTFDE